MVESVRMAVDINTEVNGVSIYGCINVKNGVVDYGTLTVDLAPEKEGEPYVRIGEVVFRTVTPALEGFQGMHPNHNTVVSSESQLIYTVTEKKNGQLLKVINEVLTIVSSVESEVKSTGTVTVTVK